MGKKVIYVLGKHYEKIPHDIQLMALCHLALDKDNEVEIRMPKKSKAKRVVP